MGVLFCFGTTLLCYITFVHLRGVSLRSLNKSFSGTILTFCRLLDGIFNEFKGLNETKRTVLKKIV